MKKMTMEIINLLEFADLFLLREERDIELFMLCRGLVKRFDFDNKEIVFLMMERWSYETIHHLYTKCIVIFSRRDSQNSTALF